MQLLRVQVELTGDSTFCKEGKKPSSERRTASSTRRVLLFALDVGVLQVVGRGSLANDPALDVRTGEGGRTRPVDRRDREFFHQDLLRILHVLDTLLVVGFGRSCLDQLVVLRVAPLRV